MPDISMCFGKDCPLKKACYRFNATPCEYWQSYFAEPPYDNEKRECEYFLMDGISGKYDAETILDNE